MREAFMGSGLSTRMHHGVHHSGKKRCVIVIVLYVSNFSYWKASEYSREGYLTMVLKKAVENRLAEKNINPDGHVKVNVQGEF